MPSDLLTRGFAATDEELGLGGTLDVRATGGPTRIMWLGDSIMNGNNSDVDPSLFGQGRKRFATLMDGSGYAYDMVGSQNSGEVGSWDHDHECHPGFTSDQLAALVVNAIQTYLPHAILVMAGINCIGLGPLHGSVADDIGHLAALLDTIAVASPYTLVLVSTLTPTNTMDGYTDAARAAFVAGMAAMVAPRTLAGRRLVLVDVGGSLSTSDLCSDRVHLSQTGNANLGTAWYGALAPWLATLSAGLPSPPLLPRTATYTLRHVWSTGTDADTSAYDEVSYLRPPGVVIDGIGRADNRAFGPPSVPALDDVLPNYDGRYSPGGTLGSFVGRGPLTTFEATWGVDVLVDASDVLVDDPDVLVDGYYTPTLFTGHITTAPQQIDRAAAQVQIRSLGTIAKLQRVKPTTVLYESIRTDEAVAALLDACGWAADLRSIDTGDATLLYWWLDGRTDGMTALRALLAAEGVPACAYEDGAGTFHFEGRQYRANATRSVEEQWRLYDGPAGFYPAVDADDVLVDDPVAVVDGPLDALRMHVVPSAWASDPDAVVGSVTATVNVRTPTAIQKIWEYGSALVLATGQVLDLPVTASDPFKSAVVPADGVDYTVSVGSLAGVALLATSGQTVTLRLTAGVSGATVLGVTSNGIQVRAVSLPVTSSNPVVSTVDVALAAARYEPKDYEIPLWPEIGWNDALDRVNAFARRYQSPREQMTVQVVNLSASHLDMILRCRVSDRVRINHTHGRVNAAFYVEQLSHALADGGGLHRLTLFCERVTDDVPARFGTARFGFDRFSE
jgi:lysophospholipase L1-like esterase